MIVKDENEALFWRANYFYLHHPSKNWGLSFLKRGPIQHYTLLGSCMIAGLKVC